MTRIIRQIAASLLIITLSACSPEAMVLDALDRGMSKKEYTPSSFELKPPSGPDKYQKGWMDGCESGLASTNQMVKPQFRNFIYNLDPVMSQDPMYYRIWQDAYDYCAFSMLTLMKYNSELK